MGNVHLLCLKVVYATSETVKGSEFVASSDEVYLNINFQVRKTIQRIVVTLLFLRIF